MEELYIRYDKLGKFLQTVAAREDFLKAVVTVIDADSIHEKHRQLEASHVRVLLYSKESGDDDGH